MTLPEPWTLALMLLGALLVGVTKTGIGGLGLLVVAIFSNLLPTKQASGFVLPLLITGDLVAVLMFRRHAQWGLLWRLFPWTALGVGIGYLAMGRIDDTQARVLVGAIIVTMVVLHVWRQRRAKAGGQEEEGGLAFAATMGVLAGFTTLVANAAGPLMALYLLAMRLPKMEYMGTGAVFFMLLNWFKVPFMVDLGLITGETVKLNLLLAPAVVAGTLAGRWLLARISQRLFETLALVLSFLAGLRMLL